MSMLQVMALADVRFKKYVLQNRWTGTIVDRRFWTIRGAQRQAKKNVSRLNQTLSRLNKRFGKV